MMITRTIKRTASLLLLLVSSFVYSQFHVSLEGGGMNEQLMFSVGVDHQWERVGLKTAYSLTRGEHDYEALSVYFYPILFNRIDLLFGFQYNDQLNNAHPSLGTQIRFPVDYFEIFPFYTMTIRESVRHYYGIGLRLQFRPAKEKPKRFF